MKESKLIAEQALEIANLKELISVKNNCLKAIQLSCTCIGGPLNDNIKGYTKIQMSDFWSINNTASSGLSDLCEECEE